MTREWTLRESTMEHARVGRARCICRSVVVALALIGGVVAIPPPVSVVSAAPGRSAPSETLVYHSSWQTGTLDWSAHDLKWSISRGILILRPQGLGGNLGYGWIVAPYRPSRLENFAVEAVMRVNLPSKFGYGWGAEWRLTVHLGPKESGVSGRYVMGTDGLGARIYDVAASGDGQDLANGPPVVYPGRWNTYRLEVRTTSAKKADHYNFQINGVQVAEAEVGDWMQYNRIALGASSSMGLQVKSIKVYRLH